MSKFGRPFRVGIAAVLSVLLSVAYPVYAATTATTPAMEYIQNSDVIITEFQTNGGSASQEFIELYNTTDKDIVFGDPADATNPLQWKMQFFSSSSVKTGTPTWTTAATGSNSIALTGMIPAHDYYLIASTGYTPDGFTPDVSYAATSSHLMTDTGGALQLTSTNSLTKQVTAHERIMWLAPSGSTTLPQGVLASPSSGKSLQRQPNEDSEYIDSDGVMSAFGPEDAMTPLDRWVAPIVIEPTPEPTPDPNQTPDPTPTSTTDPSTGSGTTETPSIPVDTEAGNTNLTMPEITELLPNPATPLTDADDEFIEIYNPNTVSFDLKGYALQVGTTTLHTYTFPAGTTLAPLGYTAFYSSVTGLSLSNSGGQARLLDDSKQVISETTAYTTADDNAAWILVDGTWQWTTTATPGLENIIAIPVTATKTAAKTTKAAAATKTKTATTTAKKATTKAATSSKAKTTKAAVKKTAKKKVTTAKTAATTAIPDKPKPPIHKGILVGVAAVAVLYGLYEYRHDIAHKFRQLGRNRKSGVTDRLAPAGR